MLLRTPAIVFLAAGSLLASTDQQPQSPMPTFRAGIDVVSFDVTVLDRDRRPVRGLTAADFKVSIDALDQPIVGFDAIELPDRERGNTARWLREVPPDVSTNGFRPDRIVVLMLDDWTTPPEAWGMFAVRKIGHAILDELGPADLIGVVLPFWPDGGVDFTTDRSRLREAVERFRVSRVADPDPRSGACQQNSCVLGAMRGIATALRAWPDRRKLLIYVGTEGVYRYGPQNVEMGGDNASAVDSTPDLMRVFHELQRANVTVYQFDSRMQTSASSLSSLGMFSDATGGWASTGNEPWARAPQVFVENDSYYMIGTVRSTRVTPGGFHRIRVTVNRPDLSVHVRAGYYDAGREPDVVNTNAPRDTTLDRAMTGMVPAQNLPLSLTVAPFRVPGARTAAVAVIGGLDRPASAVGADTVDVAVRAFDANDRLRTSRGLWTSTLRLRPEPSTAGTVHYDTLTRLNLPPGRYEVRLSMQRASDEVTGGVSTFLTVPDFEKDRLSLSGVVLGRLTAAPLPAEHAMADVLPFSPTTRRDFARGEDVGALVRVYQGGRDLPRPASVSFRIVNDRDETVAEAKADLAASDFVSAARAADSRFLLPLARLAGGEYLLTLEAGLVGQAPVSRHVRFRVK